MPTNAFIRLCLFGCRFTVIWIWWFLWQYNEISVLKIETNPLKSTAQRHKWNYVKRHHAYVLILTLRNALFILLIYLNKCCWVRVCLPLEETIISGIPSRWRCIQTWRVTFNSRDILVRSDWIQIQFIIAVAVVSFNCDLFCWFCSSRAH